MGRGGVEPPTPGFSVGVSLPSESTVTPDTPTCCDDGHFIRQSGAQQIAQHYGQETAEIDPDLVQLIEAWNTLDGDAREAVLAIINAMKRG